LALPRKGPDQIADSDVSSSQRANSSERSRWQIYGMPVVRLRWPVALGSEAISKRVATFSVSVDRPTVNWQDLLPKRPLSGCYTVKIVPELPEVETVKRGLQPTVEGRRFTYVETRRGDLRIPFPEDFENRLTGRRVERLWRRAKYIMADLDGGETLVIHLGMSGRITVYGKGAARGLGAFHYEMAGGEIGRGKHDHVVFDTDAPARIVFTDHRRFGLMTIVETASLESHKLFKGLGVEPLSKQFDAEYLKEALRNKKTPIKSALLDQRVIAGMGNIYVCEALWRSRISPKRQAARVKRYRSMSWPRPSNKYCGKR